MPKSPNYFHNTMNLPFFSRKNGPAAKRDHFATDPFYVVLPLTNSAHHGILNMVIQLTEVEYHMEYGP